MHFLWVPLYCTGSCVSTTKDTDTTHAVQTAACLSVSFSTVPLYCTGSCVSTTTDTTHTVHAAAYQYQLSFSACLLFLLILFLWVPLYCTDTSVSTTTHTVPAAVVSFSPCLYLHMQAAVSQKFLILQPKR